MEYQIEIEGVGCFDIKHNYLHRGNSRIVTFQKGKYSILQFDSYRKDLLDTIFQLGYDFELNKIYLRVIKTI